MKYVVDSATAFKWAVPELDTDKALRLRDDSRNAVHELFAPDVFPIELGHALTRAERQRRLAPPNGWAAWLAIMVDKPNFESSLALMPRAFDLSSQFRIGIYDCLYVALAEREGCEFITPDNRLVTNLQVRFPFVVPLSSLP